MKLQAARAVMLSVAAAVALTACTSSPPTDTSRAANGTATPQSEPIPPGLAITVTQGNCGATWRASGGIVTFQITNKNIQTTGVDLVDPTNGGVYAEVESLAPNVTRPMRVQVGRGAYAFRCYPEDNDAVTGPTVKVASGTGTPAVRPVSNVDLAGPIKAYDAYVARGVVVLARDVAALDAAVKRGNRADVEAAWLTAHLAYNRLGAAYGAFGDFADAIDGLPDGLPGGVTDPGFTGFHRIEYGLWHGASLPSIGGYADRLVTDVKALRADLPNEQIDPNDMPLRAHEIMENALQFELTGDADQGSGTSLATALANVDGTQQVLNAIEPVIKPRYAAWSILGPKLATARQALAAAQRPNGTWIPVDELPGPARQRIDAAAGGLLEALAPIATIGDVRRTQ